MDLESDSRKVEPEKNIVHNEETNLPTMMELTSVSPNCLGRPYRYVYSFTGFYQGKPGYIDWAPVKQDVDQNERHGVCHEEFSYPGETTFAKPRRNQRGRCSPLVHRLRVQFATTRELLLVLDAT